MATTKSYKVSSLETFNGSQEAIEELRQAEATISSLNNTISGMMNGTVASVPAQTQAIDLKAGAFENCSQLQVYDTWTTSLGKRCFKNCSSLRTVNRIEGFIDVPDEAFSGCSNLETIYTTDFRNVSFAAFAGCYRLRSEIYTTGSVGEQAFANCESITTIHIGRFNGSYALENCTSLQTVYLSSNMGNIYWGTFKGCTSLTTIIGMEYAYQISNEAFANCSSLTSITIPDKQTSPLNENVFAGCTSLSYIEYLGTVSQAAVVFENLSSDVPATTIQCSDGIYTR